MSDKPGNLGKYHIWCENEISLVIKSFLEHQKELALKSLINITSEDLLTIGRITGYLHGMIKSLEIFNKQSYDEIKIYMEEKNV